MIDTTADEYASKYTSKESDVLRKLYRETNLKLMNPRMLSGHLQGKFLEFISCMLQPKQILEIGTFTGYSAISLAKGLSENGKLHTIDINAELETMARKYFDEAGLSSKIQLYIGDALEVIPKINETFDLVFIDADKEEYLKYFDIVIVLHLSVSSSSFFILSFILFFSSSKRLENSLGNIRGKL